MTRHAKSSSSRRPARLPSALDWPLRLTFGGMLAERAARAFWPLWTLAITALALLMLGLHEHISLESAWGLAVGFVLAGLVALGYGLWRFRLPRRAEVLARLDATMPGRPIGALQDAQAIGARDAASVALWRAHQARMRHRAEAARAPAPDLRVSRLDSFGLRYIALTLLAVALLFGSVLRLGTVAQMTPGAGAALATGPMWEGWAEPPAYTGLPTLYLNDIPAGDLRLPQGSRITLRLYGAPGALTVTETVSGRNDPEQNDATAEQGAQGFTVARSGRIEIEGADKAFWDVAMIADMAPKVTISRPATSAAAGETTVPFAASDDHAVVSGSARIALDLDAVDRRYGLEPAPEPRAPIELDLPMPISGDRARFEETLIENLSQHAWANLPVTVTLSVRDAAGQVGDSAPMSMNLAARRFFDPMAAAVIEQRRDLLWTRGNGARVAQVLRAISYRPEGIFRSETAYLRLRVILRRLEAAVNYGGLDAARQEELAEALWGLALLLEDGTLSDALERMRQAQERLSEAMKNGATDEEIARLMQELRDATQNYLRQLAEQQQQQDGEGQQSAENENSMTLSQDDLQRMMDRIQELMEQGRMAEAQQALEEFQRMMENMRAAQGGQGDGQRSPGQQAMEGLAETLRDQQGLSDQAFRDLQEQFNPGANAGESQGNEGRNGGRGRGQSHEGQSGRGQGQDGEVPPEGQGQGGAQSLADRQEALRRELQRQAQQLPGAGTAEGDAAREALDRAGRAMGGAEEALRNDNLAEAIDRQSEAMEALREGMRNLGEAMAQAEREQRGQQGQAEADGRGAREDPLGRSAGTQGQVGTQENLLQGEDVYRRARDLLDEIRRRSGEGARPEVERDYLRRLLDRF